MSETNVELVRGGFAAAVLGDFEAISALLDPDVKWHGGDPAGAGSCRNRGQALDFMRRAHERGRLGEPVEVIGAGEQVVVIIQPAPQGAKQAPPVANLTTFRNGKVIEMIHFPNPEDALVAAGLTI